jgi:DNA-binding response OmpR family regulator
MDHHGMAPHGMAPYGTAPHRTPRGTVLVVEDDPAVAQCFGDLLGSEGYAVVHALTATRAKELLPQTQPDVILLDLMLPDGDGLVLCADFRARTPAPIIVCSATNRTRDAVLALKLGADAFLPKPFEVDELLTRIHVLQQRTTAALSGSVRQRESSEPAAAPTHGQAVPGPAPEEHGSTFGALRLDDARKQVTLAGVHVAVTPTEYRLLAILLTHPDEVVPRDTLSQQVWGYTDVAIGRSMDVHLHRLRTKLRAAQQQAGCDAPLLLSDRGFGYRITCR